MTVADNVISIFERFNAQKEAQIHDGQSIMEKETYHAVEIEKSGRRLLRLQINFSDGGIDLCSYNQLADIYSASSNFLSLIFVSGVVYIEGENLRELLKNFREERVLLIQPFDSNKHKTPEKGTPVIHKIDWRTPDQVIEKTGSS